VHPVPQLRRYFLDFAAAGLLSESETSAPIFAGLPRLRFLRPTAAKRLKLNHAGLVRMERWCEGHSHRNQGNYRIDENKVITSVECGTLVDG
jgi:hypothetical protein